MMDAKFMNLNPNKMNIVKRPIGKSKPYNTINEDYLIERHKDTQLFIPPTKDNFKGTDNSNPIVCSVFGCDNHLTTEQQLYGTKCIHHQLNNQPKGLIDGHDIHYYRRLVLRNLNFHEVKKGKPHSIPKEKTA